MLFLPFCEGPKVIRLSEQTLFRKKVQPATSYGNHPSPIPVSSRNLHSDMSQMAVEEDRLS